MTKGSINCICGQYFGFETAAEIIVCPSCGHSFIAEEHAEISLIASEEIPSEDTQRSTYEEF